MKTVKLIMSGLVFIAMCFGYNIYNKAEPLIVNDMYMKQMTNESMSYLLINIYPYLKYIIYLIMFFTLMLIIFNLIDLIKSSK